MTAPTGSAYAADLALVQAVLGGDREAADRLADRMVCIGRILAARARALCGGLPESDLLDVAQDVTAKVLARLGDYAGRAAFESWVYAFCEGELRNALRRRQRNRTGVDGGELEQLPAAATIAEDYADLYRCLERLGPGERQLVRQKHFDALRLDDIAVRAATNLNTIKSRYYRALVQLRHCLDRAAAEDR